MRGEKRCDRGLGKGNSLMVFCFSDSHPVPPAFTLAGNWPHVWPPATPHGRVQKLPPLLLTRQEGGEPIGPSLQGSQAPAASCARSIWKGTIHL